ncbi:uncharacterized [Tachysurus ichikawai]
MMLFLLFTVIATAITGAPAHLCALILCSHQIELRHFIRAKHCTRIFGQFTQLPWQQEFYREAQAYGEALFTLPPPTNGRDAAQSIYLSYAVLE